MYSSQPTFLVKSDTIEDNEHNMNKTTTYLRNLMLALVGYKHVEYKVVTQVRYKWKDNVVYQKDPDGLIKRDISILKKFMRSKNYKVGDPLESVAYRQGQEDLLYMIVNKLIAPRNRKLF